MRRPLHSRLTPKGFAGQSWTMWVIRPGLRSGRIADGKPPHLACRRPAHTDGTGTSAAIPTGRVRSRLIMGRRRFSMPLGGRIARQPYCRLVSSHVTPKLPRLFVRFRRIVPRSDTMRVVMHGYARKRWVTFRENRDPSETAESSRFGHRPASGMTCRVTSG